MFLIFYGKIEKKISINKEDFLHREEERMKEPVLIVMAAGMGSRYGGLKQMDPVDVQGHAILDFSVYDAKRAGFKKVVFIILFCYELFYSVRSAVTGSLFAAFFDGISPPISVSTTLSAIRITAGTGGSTALTLVLSATW